MTSASPRANSIGALRLFLASAVVVSHAPELLDGNLGREPLHWIFGTMTLGAVAVDGFFLISGALIAGSWLSDPRSYFLKRVLRIYPAFVVSFLICLAVATALSGASGPHDAGDLARLVMDMVCLKAPHVDKVFPTLPIQAVNGSMWSISYEFRCYLLAAACGAAGLYRRRRVFLALTAAVLAANLLFLVPAVAKLDASAAGALTYFLGRPSWTVRMTGLFMVGTCFRLFRPTLDGRVALACLALSAAMLFVPVLGEIALATLGAYALFWVAYHCRTAWLLRLNARDDISYGLYLYAFPITQLLILANPHIWLLALDVLALALSMLAGWVSWVVIERPALRLKRLDFLRGLTGAGDAGA
jgi:peptidoglycan/LPS O-acetylase OafA/YrhL